METTIKKSAVEALADVREKHIDKINKAIDAIIDLEDFYPMPSDLSIALRKLNSIRSIAEEEIEVGDKVFDTFTKKIRVVSQDGAVNFFFDDEDKEHSSIGKKFCFKMHY